VKSSFALTKSVRNEQLVRELDRKRHHELFLVALTGLILTVAVIVYALPHFEMIRLGYRMEDLRARRVELLKTQHHLELQRATESDPARIESVAEKELEMIYPDREHRIVIEPVGPDSNPVADPGGLKVKPAP
jgi:cell division protein FtsL